VHDRHNGIVFAAETLGCSPAETLKTAKAGFNYIFNSSKWWDFYSPWLFEQYELTRGTVRSISFPESHDTTRLAADYHGHIDSLKRNCFLAALFSAGFMIPIGFEFGFQNQLHVVKTRPADWEQTDIDLTAYITGLNKARLNNPVFQEDAPTITLPSSNHQVLFLWKGASSDKQEALIILNRDPFNKQYFRCENLYDHIQLPGPLIDVSPEYPLDYLPTPYEYDLRPGQGVVLVTESK
jgi:starch synthase (maltosyl-transferring)